jgi:hypothetical protein
MIPSLLKRSLPVFAAMLLGMQPTQATDDLILEWNAYIREVMKRDSANSNPGWATRSLTLMHGAMYDVFQAYNRTHRPLKVDATAPVGSSKRAAAAQAAYRILLTVYPEHKEWIDWAGGYSLHFVPDGPAKSEGVAFGESVAAQYLSWRSNDGSDDHQQYMPSSEPGKWRPDPTFFPAQQAWGPGWGAVTPYVITSSSQFPVPPPPAMTSAEYTDAFNEVVALGSRTGSTRTADQTQIGNFWAYDRSGTGPPPRLFSRNLSEIATQQGNTEEENARLFAIASVAMADAAIAAWDVKFQHNVWRPITAVREAGTDGNPATAAITSWVPLGCPGDEVFPNFTPAFPAYVSGHASMGEALFTVLKSWYGTNTVSFSLTSEELPGVTRSYTSFSQAAQENADSRVYLGVHWRFDQTEGQSLGRRVAEYVFANAMGSIEESFDEFCGTNNLSGNPNNDQDKDGCTDFAEYAFTTNPVQPDQPNGARQENLYGLPCIVLRYRVSDGRLMNGLEVRAESSADLQSWTSEGITDELDPDATPVAGMTSRRAWLQLKESGTKFLRLRAER